MEKSDLALMNIFLLKKKHLNPPTAEMASTRLRARSFGTIPE